MKELVRFRDKVCVVSGAGQGIGLATARRMAVNNVGGTRQIKPFELYSLDEIRFEVDKSLWTALVCCRTVLPFKGIRINCVAPGATKVADRTTPRSSAAEEAENAQWIDELYSMQESHIPMGRWGNPEEQAAAIAFMASDDASFITGQILSVGGGLTAP